MSVAKRTRIILALENLRNSVNTLATVYEDYPTLNNEIDIQKIIPMSLDEWVLEISSTIEIVRRKLPL